MVTQRVKKRPSRVEGCVVYVENVPAGVLDELPGADRKTYNITVHGIPAGSVVRTFNVKSPWSYLPHVVPPAGSPRRCFKTAEAAAVGATQYHLAAWPLTEEGRRRQFGDVAGMAAEYQKRFAELAVSRAEYEDASRRAEDARREALEKFATLAGVAESVAAVAKAAAAALGPQPQEPQPCPIPPSS